ncbi:hypothetical protein [Bosea sp. (in: a-proteobacteria)]
MSQPNASLLGHRLETLDGLRLVAALSVALFHFGFLRLTIGYTRMSLPAAESGHAGAAPPLRPGLAFRGAPGPGLDESHSDRLGRGARLASSEWGAAASGHCQLSPAGI